MRVGTKQDTALLEDVLVFRMPQNWGCGGGKVATSPSAGPPWLSWVCCEVGAGAGRSLSCTVLPFVPHRLRGTAGKLQ